MSLILTSDKSRTWDPREVVSEHDKPITFLCEATTFRGKV